MNDLLLFFTVECQQLSLRVHRYACCGRRSAVLYTHTKKKTCLVTVQTNTLNYLLTPVNILAVIFISVNYGIRAAGEIPIFSVRLTRQHYIVFLGHLLNTKLSSLYFIHLIIRIRCLLVTNVVPLVQLRLTW